MQTKVLPNFYHVFNHIHNQGMFLEAQLVSGALFFFPIFLNTHSPAAEPKVDTETISGIFMTSNYQRLRQVRIS